MGNVISFAKEKKKLEPVLDAKGRRVPYFLRSRFTQVIFYRRQFRKLKIPPLFVSTGETTLGRAKVRSEIMVQRHKNKFLGISDDHVFGAKITDTVESVVEEILERVTPTLREKTQAKHKIYFEKIKHEFGPKDIKSVDLADFDDWIREERRRGQRETFMDYQKHMNLLMRYAYSHKMVPSLVSFPNPDKQRKTKGRVFTRKELQAMWENMNETTRDQFVLSYECFMRLREVLYLSWDRVDLKTGHITLRPEDVKTGSKTGRGRTFIASPTALKRLRARRAKHPATKFVFPARFDKSKPADSNKTAWNAVKRAAKVRKRARWHDLRHTALTRALLEKKAAPIAVSEYAGVSLVTLQRVYLHSKAEQTRDVSSVLSIEE